MATKKRKSNSRIFANSKTVKTKNSANNQLLSVIWFAVAIFLLCVVFIKGQNVWLAIHNVMFGIFGVLAYFYPVLLGAIAVFCAMDKFTGSIKAKLLETNILVILIGAAIDIFIDNKAAGFWQQVRRKN